MGIKVKLDQILSDATKQGDIPGVVATVGNTILPVEWIVGPILFVATQLHRNIVLIFWRNLWLTRAYTNGLTEELNRISMVVIAKTTSL